MSVTSGGRGGRNLPRTSSQHLRAATLSGEIRVADGAGKCPRPRADQLPVALESDFDSDFDSDFVEGDESLAPLFGVEL